MIEATPNVPSLNVIQKRREYRIASTILALITSNSLFRGCSPIRSEFFDFRHLH